MKAPAKAAAAAVKKAAATPRAQAVDLTEDRTVPPKATPGKGKKKLVQVGSDGPFGRTI
ncbi:hypothetical protein D3C78_1045460 [compost metagenome]